VSARISKNKVTLLMSMLWRKPQGTFERETGRNNLVKANKISSDTRSENGRKWKKPTSFSFVAAVWAIAPLFLAAAPLIIFGSARTFVIREKFPSGIVLNVHIERRRERSNNMPCFIRREWFTSLSVRVTLTFIKSEFFIKNVASAYPNQHRPESGRNYARC